MIREGKERSGWFGWHGICLGGCLLWGAASKQAVKQTVKQALFLHTESGNESGSTRVNREYGSKSGSTRVNRVRPRWLGLAGQQVAVKFATGCGEQSRRQYLPSKSGSQSVRTWDSQNRNLKP